MYKTYFYLLIITLITSCSNNNKNLGEVTNIHFPEGSINISESFDFRFVRLETNDDCLIANIHRMEVYNDKIFVHDFLRTESSLLVFDINGKFLTRISSKGGAQDEYYEIAHFAIDKENNKLIISDRRKKRLMYFDPDNSKYLYSKEFKIGHTDFFASKDRYYFFSHAGFYESRNDHYVMVTDTALNILFEDLECKFRTHEILSMGSNFFYESQNQVFVYHQSYPFIHKVNDNNCEVHSKLSFEGLKFPTLDKADEANTNSQIPDMRYNDNLEKSSANIRAYAILETNDIIFVSLSVGVTIRFALYNKTTKESYLMSHYDFFTSTGLNITFSPNCVADDEIVCTIPMFQGIHKVKDKIKNDDFSAIIDSVKSDDNPVLCFMKWKK